METLKKKSSELRSCVKAYYFSKCSLSASTSGSNSLNSLSAKEEELIMLGLPKQAIPDDAFRQIKHKNCCFL